MHTACSGHSVLCPYIVETLGIISDDSLARGGATVARDSAMPGAAPIGFDARR